MSWYHYTIYLERNVSITLFSTLSDIRHESWFITCIPCWKSALLVILFWKLRKGKRTENNTEKPKPPYHIWNTTGINTFKYRLFILNQRCSVLFLIRATTIKKIYRYNTDARYKNNIKIYSFLSEILSEKRRNCGKKVF